MLHLLDRVRISGVRAKSLHPSVGNAVEENDEALDHLCRSTLFTVGTAVPRPAQVGISAEVTSKGEDAVAEKDGAFDEVGCAGVDQTSTAHALDVRESSRGTQEGDWLTR